MTKAFEKNRVQEGLIWGISILSAGIAAINILPNLNFFWPLSRIGKLGLFFLVTLGLMVLIWLMIKKAKKNWRPLDIQQLSIILLLSVGIAMALKLTIFRKYLLDLPDAWVFGCGSWIERLAPWLLFLIVIPIPLAIFLSMVFRQISFRTRQGVSFDWKTIDQTLFIVVFFLLLSLPGLFSNNLKNLEESFWGDKTLITLFSRLRYYLGDKVFDEVIIGEDEWLVFASTSSINDYQTPWKVPEEDLEQIYQQLTQFEVALEARDINFLTVIAPNKNTIYPEYVPDEIPVLGETSRLDQVLAYLDTRGGVQIMDLR